MDEIQRKNLEDTSEFFQLRQATEKISEVLNKRLRDHLSVVQSLFIPRRLMGTYIKSTSNDEVPGSEKVFAELAEMYAAVCEQPFGLPKKLSAPLPPISNKIDGTSYQYSLNTGSGTEKITKITCPTRWILSYQSKTSLGRVRKMLAGDDETPQPDEIRQTIIDHLVMVLFLKRFPALRQLLEDLRYTVEVMHLADLGGLPVIILQAPVVSFLPPDDFINNVTMMSGIQEFKELVDLEALNNIPDPLQDVLKSAIE